MAATALLVKVFRFVRTFGSAAALSTVGAALVLAGSALAVKPSAGCWGTCGGDVGPVHGYFVISEGKIMNGVEAEFRCLGVQQIKQPTGPPAAVGDTLVVPAPANSHSLPSSLKISKGGHFSFHGDGQRISGSKTSKVMVDLSGEFVSTTKALLTFHIAYGNCGAQHLTIKRAG